MKNRFLMLSTILPLLLMSCGREDPAEIARITIINPSSFPRIEAFVTLNAGSLTARYPYLDLSKIILKASTGKPLPFQANDTDEDGQAEEVAFVVGLEPNEELSVTIEPLGEGEELPEFKKRTQAEISHKVGGHWEGREYQGGSFQNTSYLRVPPEHTDHSWFIRYEGPGWESDKVGYRFYLDWRNATDIFGKKTTEMVLQDVGQDGFDSYHEPAAWGMDILKVGKSLGLGSPAFWTGDSAMRVEKTDSIICSIPLNGPIQSMARTHYYGWDTGERAVGLTSELSIHAGSRLTRNDLQLDAPLANLCTGIVKHEGALLLADDSQAEWSYLASWGPQSLDGAQLGMAVLFKRTELIQQTEDEHNHVVVLRPDDKNALTYYFLAAWEHEPGGIKTEGAFRSYLDQTVRALSSPVKITYGDQYGTSR